MALGRNSRPTHLVLDPPDRQAANQVEAAMAEELVEAAMAGEPMEEATAEEPVAATKVEEPVAAAVARAAQVPVVEHISRNISSTGGLYA